MGTARRFDYDEAVARYKAGESVTAIARSYGVTPGAVYRATNPNTIVNERRATAAFYERNRVPCEDCGKPCLSANTRMKHPPDGRSLCARCRSIVKTERFQYDLQGELIAVRCSMINCENGERWQRPEAFTKGMRYHHVRPGGIHSTCKQCQTQARRNYRAKHREKQRAYDREYHRRRNTIQTTVV